MIDYIQITNKLKEIISQDINNEKISDKDVAAVLDIDYNNFRKQKARNSPHYPEIMQFLAKRNISINWFFFNQLPESLIENTSNYIILKYQKSVITSAGGGAINDELNSNPLVIDKQLLDHINSSYKNTEVLQVFGDSMEPYIKDGSLVFVDKSKINLNIAGVYVINTLEGLYVKKIKMQDNKYYMKSSNKQYDDVKLDEFEVIGQVKGVYIKV